MNTISVQEIKRRGLSFLDKELEAGPVHVIQSNELRYVILTEEGYQEFLKQKEEADIARIKASWEEAKSKKTIRGSAKKLAKTLGLDD